MRRRDHTNPLDHWTSDFFDWSCNARGRVRLLVEGDYNDLWATLTDDGVVVAEGRGQTLDEAMDDLFGNMVEHE